MFIINYHLLASLLFEIIFEPHCHVYIFSFLIGLQKDDKEIEQSPLKKASVDLTKGVADYGLSDSSSEDASCESSAEGFSIS